jgi:hypothetical protein
MASYRRRHLTYVKFSSFRRVKLKIRLQTVQPGLQAIRAGAPPPRIIRLRRGAFSPARPLIRTPLTKTAAWSIPNSGADYVE